MKLSGYNLKYTEISSSTKLQPRDNYCIFDIRYLLLKDVFPRKANWAAIQLIWFSYWVNHIGEYNARDVHNILKDFT